MDAKCVLLREASHSTSEFYARRAEITKCLVSEKGFSFVAVEGDWPGGFAPRIWRWAGIQQSPSFKIDSDQLRLCYFRN
jgi:hypothetical protein